MAKNLVNGTNVVIEENGDNINMNLSSAYTTNLQQEINDSFKENNTYSTTEAIIGTWIDNKPLYRKVFTGTLGTEEVYIDISSLSCDFCYLEKGFLISRGGPIYVIPTSYDVVESHTTFEINLSQNKCRLQNGGSSSPYLHGTYYIILEYTKTTD